VWVDGRLGAQETSLEIRKSSNQEARVLR
jgi:hypothetical protein